MLPFSELLLSLSSMLSYHQSCGASFHRGAVRVVSLEELQKHASAEDCWCAVHGLVYNLTPFLQAHPGGSTIIVKYAGKDATGPFDASGHPRDIVSKLGLDRLTVGRLEQPAMCVLPAACLCSLVSSVCM
jgi:cytochrome b involved in lipid metabolism